MSPGILSLLILLLPLSIKAQPKETIVEYFDKDWQVITDPKSAVYYRTLEEDKEKFIIRDYLISGKIQMMAACSRVAPNITFDGPMVLYYENGIIQEEGLLRNNKQSGLYKSYYENGKPKIVMSYEKEKPKYIHYWSEDGAELLPNGKGIVPAQPNPKNYQYDEIEDSVQIAGFSIEAGDTVYSIMDQSPEYEGGYENMLNRLSALLTYPKDARKRRIEGSVFVQFIIDQKGAVSNCKVQKGIHPECDASALNAVCKLNKWKPGVHHQKPIKTRFVLPIKFKSFD